MIDIKDLKGFIKEDSINWVNAHIRNLEEKKTYLKKFGATPQDIALVGLLLFLDSKDKAIEWTKMSEDMTNTRIEAEEFLSKLLNR